MPVKDVTEGAAVSDELVKSVVADALERRGLRSTKQLLDQVEDLAKLAAPNR